MTFVKDFPETVDEFIHTLMEDQGISLVHYALLQELAQERIKAYGQARVDYYGWDLYWDLLNAGKAL